MMKLKTAPITILRLLVLLLSGGGWTCAWSEEPRFDILEFVVEGNTTLSAPAIEAAVYPYLGEGKTIADAEAARVALEKAYHQGGFLTVFVYLPDQKVEGGAVRLQVAEGEVERLRVSGSRYYSLGEIKARVPELAEGKVPYFPDVQRQLAGLSRAADRKLTPVLRAGREPGKVEVELKVADQAPLHGSVVLNDRYSADTSRTRLAGSIRWDNLWQRDHSLGFSYQVAPQDPDDSKALSATYSAPLTSGHYLAAYAVLTESDVATLGTLGVIGNGTIIGLRYILPLRARPHLVHSLTLGVDYKDFDQTVRLQGADSFNTPIRYLPFSLAWDGTWGGEAGTRLNLGVHFHLRELVGKDSEFANKRFKGSSGYAFLRGSLTRNWRQASGAELSLRAGFQLADQPLISNEGYALGGTDTVRGYLESEVLGDRGLNVGVEWQSPPWSGVAKTGEWRALAFLEGGRAWVIDPQAGQVDRYSLAGAGLGLRFRSAAGIDGGLDLAWPLEDAGRTRAGDGRLHARLGYSF